jgi:hypothetical protein
LYRETALASLRACGIAYSNEMFTSLIDYDRPYTTYGRLASIELMTPRQAVALGAVLKNDGRREEPLVYGWQIAAALWGLLHDIRDDGPPSKYTTDIGDKFQRDVAALRRYGY